MIKEIFKIYNQNLKDLIKLGTKALEKLDPSKEDKLRIYVRAEEKNHNDNPYIKLFNLADSNNKSDFLAAINYFAEEFPLDKHYIDMELMLENGEYCFDGPEYDTTIIS